MGACNFSVSGLTVAVGMDVETSISAEEIADYRADCDEYDTDDEQIKEWILDNEADWVGENFALAGAFAKDLNDFVWWHFFNGVLDENPLEVRASAGYYSGFEITAQCTFSRRHDAQQWGNHWEELYSKYYADNVGLTLLEFSKLLEKALDFVDYALIRIAERKGWGFVSGGWTGGVGSTVNKQDVRDYARFKIYGSRMATTWAKFVRDYCNAYNEYGL